jgi:hypothetical protein
MYYYNKKDNKRYTPTYWNNNGKFQKEYEKLYEQLVPKEGEAPTQEGELLRCISQFYYDRYNNGHCNNMSYAMKIVNSFLKQEKNAPAKAIKYKMLDKDLDDVVDYIVKHVLGA